MPWATPRRPGNGVSKESEEKRRRGAGGIVARAFLQGSALVQSPVLPSGTLFVTT